MLSRYTEYLKGTLPDILDLDALGVVPLEVVEGALQPRQRVEELLDGHGGGTLIQTAELLYRIGWEMAQTGNAPHLPHHL